MDFATTPHFTDENITFSNHLPAIGQSRIIADILHDLTSLPRRISSMFFYDAVGSKLFEEITQLAEYYQSRIEKRLLKRAASGLAGRLADIDIVELGSGDCSKVSLLLDEVGRSRMGSVRYTPLDVSIEALRESATTLVAKYPGLKVNCIAADFLTQLHLLANRGPRLFCFFGSTLGNLTPQQRSSFLNALGQLMQVGDLLLLGVDLVKPREILERAYNDTREITARFNRNILSVVNRIAHTDFEPERFEHVAFFNEELNRVEMHLKATAEMTVCCPHLAEQMTIARAESIHTENSYKFTVKQIVGEIQACGLKTDMVLTDQLNWFSLLQIAKSTG